MANEENNRDKLKGYFKRNKIPTQDNFAELIDGMLNQKDDGIVKLPSQPLSVQAEGDDLKKALNFYRNFTNEGPVWALCLNPWLNRELKTTKPGWSICNANGTSRFFIDEGTGSVGIGSVTPGINTLQIRKDLKHDNTKPKELGPILSIFNGAAGGLGSNASIDFSTRDTENYPPTVRIQSIADGRSSSHLVFCTKIPGDYKNDIVERLRINSDGNVGIGTMDPKVKLEVHGDIAVTGKISCGGKILLKTAHNTCITARAEPDLEGVVRHIPYDPKNHSWEEFTLEMACSREFKENINFLSTEEAVSTLERLAAVKYDYKGQKSFRQNMGFIAEDMPDNLACEGRQTLSPFEFVPVLTKVAQEQQRMILGLRSVIEGLTGRIEQLSAELHARAPC